MIVDIHGHITSPELRKRFPIPPSLVDIDGMLERKAAAGIDLTIVGTPVGAGTMIRLDGHDNYAQTSDELKAYNHWIGEAVAARPDQLRAYAYTNPFGGERMLDDVATTVRDGAFVGLIVSTSVRGEYLDSERAEDFFAMVDELDVPVFLHPPAEPVGASSLRDFRLVEQVGRYCDATMGLAALIFGGVLERHPRLQLVAATSGGALALVIDRLDTAYAPTHWAGSGTAAAAAPPPDRDPRPPALRYTNRISRPPSSFLSRIHVDTTNASPANLAANVAAFGPGRVMFGTDSPPLDTPLVEVMNAITDLPLSAEDTAAILGGNACRLFGLGPGAS